MSLQLLPALLALAFAAGPLPSDTTDAAPYAAVDAAFRAVEGDSIAAVRARWLARAASPSAQLGLATLDRLTYAFDAATQRYRALASRGGPRFAAWAHLGLAEAAEQRGWRRQLLAELDSARAAARLVGDREAEGAALVFRSITTANNGSTAAGLAELDTAARLLPPTSLALHGERLRRRGLILAVMQRPAESAAAADSSLALAQRTGRVDIEAEAMRTTAIRLLYTAQEDSARPVLREAERLYLRARDHAGAAYTMLFRLDDETGRGLIGAARVTAAAVRREAAIAHDDQSAATAFVVDASLSSRVGDYRRAMRQLDSALVRFGRLGDDGSTAMSRGYRAAVELSLGRIEDAVSDARAAVERYRRTGYTLGLAQMEQLLAAIEIRAGRLDAASRAIVEAGGLAAAHPKLSGRDALAYVRGWLALERGHHAEARRQFAEALAEGGEDNGLQRYDVRTRIAQSYAREGKLAAAEREMTAASETLDRWRSGLSDAELRTLVFQTSPFDYSDRGSIAAEVIATLAAGGHEEAAFALAERRRARELLDRLVGATVLGSAQGEAAPIPANWRSPAGPGTTAAAIARALPDSQTALLEYFVGGWGAPTTAFLVTRTGTRAFILPTADSLAPSVVRLTALLESGERPAALQRALGRALLDSVVATLPRSVTRLLVVPDGVLHRVPFDALVLANGRAVVERYAVGVVPSAAVAATLWSHGTAPEREAARVLALGDPAFVGERAAAEERDRSGIGAHRSAFAASGGLARLASSGDEARMVARYGRDSEVRLRDAASESYFVHAPLARFGVIHLATHALVDESGAANSAIALAPGNGDDGFVTPAELAELDLRASLVVLSACRTAGGVIVSGEGVQGLTAPLLQAGARAVVATEWRIDDRATVRFVRDFYDALAGGAPVADALRAAKLRALRRGAPPGEWAAFTAVGDPVARVALRRPRFPVLPVPWAIAAAALLLAACGGVLYWRTSSARRPERGVPAEPSPVRIHH